MRINLTYKFMLASALWATTAAYDAITGSAPAAVAAAWAKQTLTLDHLKSGSYQIPDLACGYTTVPLVHGKGERDGVQVLFGRAFFGTLGDRTELAVVHLAYKTDELGWQQQLVFVQPEGARLMQIAEYGLDEGEQLKDIAVTRGEVVVETAIPARGSNPGQQMVTKIRLSSGGPGCMLQATRWDREPATGKLVPHADLQPYLAAVEERIGKCWSPARKDRGEHVSITFKIKPSGEVEDVRVRQSSEVQSADLAAVEAVEQAAPFPPLPRKSNQELDVCMEFQANVSVSKPQ